MENIYGLGSQMAKYGMGSPMIKYGMGSQMIKYGLGSQITRLDLPWLHHVEADVICSLQGPSRIFQAAVP